MEVAMRRWALAVVLLLSLVAACTGEAASTTTLNAAPTSSTVEMTTTTARPVTTTTSTTTTTTVPLPDVPATVILHGGPVITMDPELGIVEAVAIDGDQILAVGDAQSILTLADPDTVVIDLEGKTVLPGLIDAHSHWISDDHLAGIYDAEVAAHTAAQWGVTTMYDMFVKPEDLAELVALDEAGGLPVRVTVYFPVNYLTRYYGLWFTDYTPGEMLSPHVRVGGAKFFTDPTDPDTMYLSEPHSNQPGYYGDFAITPPEEIISLVVQLDDLGWQVAIHTGGDAGLDVVLDAFEAALDGGPNDLRHRVEHLPVVRDDQIERMLSLGVVASFQLTWFHSDWIGDPDWGSFEENLGPERIAWAGRWRDLLDSGVTVIGGSDHPWTPPVSIGGFGEAVTRTGVGGLAPEPWMAAQTITIEEAIALLTVDAAYGAFEENVKGTLTPGKLADLIVVSANPLQIPPEQLFDLEVLVTVVGGETVYCAQAGSSFCP
jgi:predicted amidohydrolase YtcJ